MLLSVIMCYKMYDQVNLMMHMLMIHRNRQKKIYYYIIITHYHIIIKSHYKVSKK